MAPLARQRRDEGEDNPRTLIPVSALELDPEIAALAAISEIMASLHQDEQRRVAAWTVTRYGR